MNVKLIITAVEVGAVAWEAFGKWRAKRDRARMAKKAAAKKALATKQTRIANDNFERARQLNAELMDRIND